MSSQGYLPPHEDTKKLVFVLANTLAYFNICDSLLTLSLVSGLTLPIILDQAKKSSQGQALKVIWPPHL
jgi:hypothetical protein